MTDTLDRIVALGSLTDQQRVISQRWEPDLAATYEVFEGTSDLSTLRQALQQAQVAGLFETLVVSDAVGSYSAYSTTGPAQDVLTIDLGDYEDRPNPFEVTWKKTLGTPSRSDTKTMVDAASFGAGQIRVITKGTLPAWWDSAQSKLNELLCLPPGWDSYGADAVHPRAAVTALEVLYSVAGYGASAPSIVPTTAGGIDLEWHRGGIGLVVSIGPTGETSAWYEDLRSGQEWEGSVTPDLGQLAAILERLA